MSRTQSPVSGHTSTARHRWNGVFRAVRSSRPVGGKDSARPLPGVQTVTWKAYVPQPPSCRATVQSQVLSASALGLDSLKWTAQPLDANGNQLYRFGETVSIVFWTDTWRPESFFDRVKKNRQNGMHTLCLLDIKVKEQSLENLIKGRRIYEPARYMTVNLAARQLLEIVENQRARGEEPAVTEDTLCVGLARVGAEDQRIAAGTLQQMCTVDLGGPLHSLIITGGSLHPLETEMLSLFPVPEASPASRGTDGPHT